jgi:hypothetical protein
MLYFVALSALVAIAWAEPGNAQQVKAGVTCDVSEGMGYIIGSQKRLSCSFAWAQMCWSGAQTGLSHCSLYHSAGRRASMSPSVLQLFISGFRGSDECLAESHMRPYRI